jgi:hypothetical protein
MELPIEFRQHASAICKDIPHNPEESNSAYLGYITGALDMLKAVEAAFKNEVASIQREHDRTENLQYKSDLNQQMKALTLLHFKLQSIKPL